MSSLIRKGGVPKFKPKAPQGRKPLGATATPSAPSSTRPSIDRQSETPASPARNSTPSPTAVPPLVSVTELVDHQDAPPVEQPSIAQDVVPAQETTVADITDDAGENRLEESAGVQQHLGITDAHQEIPILTSEEISQTSDSISTLKVVDRATSVVEKPVLVAPNAAQHAEPVARVPQDVSVAGDIGLSMLVPGEVDQPAQLVPTARLLPDGTAEILNVPRPQKSARRPTKRRKLDENGVEIRQTIEVQINKASARRRRRRRGSQDPARRKAREATPSDAEEQEVDHATVKMAELTQDLRIGKKFSRHAELKQREIDTRREAKTNMDNLDLDPELPDRIESSSQTVERGPPPGEASTRPQMRIVNGQIVLDDASLVVDRHAIAATTAEVLEEVEEDDFTRITTCATYMKRNKNTAWGIEEDEKFYIGLRMFGTDFEMISQMFPNRNRKQVKLKFVKDQREVPQKIANALMGESIGIDLETYKSHTGLEYQEVADIEAEHARRQEEHNEYEQRIQAEAEETSRQKRAEIQSRAPRAPGTMEEAAVATIADPGGDTGSAKENEPDRSDGVFKGGKASAASKSKKKSATKRKKRNPHSTRGGGDDFEVLGSIDAMQGIPT